MNVIKKKQTGLTLTESKRAKLNEQLVHEIVCLRRKQRRLEMLKKFNALSEVRRQSLLKNKDRRWGEDKVPHDNLLATDYSEEYWTDNFNTRLFIGNLVFFLEDSGFQVEDIDEGDGVYTLVYGKPGEFSYSSNQGYYRGRAMCFNFDGENVILEPTSRFYNTKIRHTLDDIYSYGSEEEFVKAIKAKLIQAYDDKFSGKLVR